MSAAINAQADWWKSPRIKKFRLNLIREIPRFPNDRTALQHMQQKRLGAVLVDYINWKSRYVGIRPRQIEIESAAKFDPRWSAMSKTIEVFLGKVQRGDDLTPYLSLGPHTRGYSLAANVPGATNDDRQSDKDFLLIRKGYHHFHLGIDIEKTGYAVRTDDLIFAEVTRDKFKVIAIFNHDVFDQGSAERKRLDALHDNIIFRSLPPGAAVMKGPVMSSGHAMHVFQYAQYCGRLLESIDPHLEDRSYIEMLYRHGNFDPPSKPRLEWHFLHLDLIVYDRVNKLAFCVQQGWN